MAEDQLDHPEKMEVRAEALGTMDQAELETLLLYHLHKELAAEALVDIRAATEVAAADHLDQLVQALLATIQDALEAAEQLLHFQDQALHTQAVDQVAVELIQEHTTQAHHLHPVAEVLEKIVHQAIVELTD